MLTDLQHRILAFETTWWKQTGAKDAAILHEFGVTPVRYHQMLENLLHEPAAMVADPRLVKALLAARERRAAARAAHRVSA